MKKFLIGQLARYGDCLYATSIAKQIKNDYPDSHVTWAVASDFKSVLELNPYIDEIWEVEITNGDYYDEGWNQFEREALKRKNRGIFDEVIFTQIPNSNWKNFDGSIRSSTFNSYDKPITVSPEPIIRLSEEEIENVRSFVIRNNFKKYHDVILFEFSPGSGQSFVNHEFALEVADKITQIHKESLFVFTSSVPIHNNNNRIIDASRLSFRENAELTKYCTLLIGCSSGITWLSTSDWAKRLNMIQLLSRKSAIFAGVRYDFEYWNITTENVIEITDCAPGKVVDCLNHAFKSGFKEAQKRYNEKYTPDYRTFRKFIVMFLSFHKWYEVFEVIRKHNKRNKHFHFLSLLLNAFYAILNYYYYKIRNYAKKVLKPVLEINLLN